MLNNSINSCSGMTNMPDSYNTIPVQNHFAGSVVNPTGSQQTTALQDLENKIEHENCQIIGNVDMGSNVLVDKGTSSAREYLESIMDFNLKKTYIDAQNRTSYGKNIMAVNSLLGFDYRAINKNNVQLIIIDNVELIMVDFFVYLDQLLRYENQTNEPFNGVYFLILANMYNYPARPNGFCAPNLMNKDYYDENIQNRLETLHVGLHNSCLELWALAGFTVLNE